MILSAARNLSPSHCGPVDGRRRLRTKGFHDVLHCERTKICYICHGSVLTTLNEARLFYVSTDPSQPNSLFSTVHCAFFDPHITHNGLYRIPSTAVHVAMNGSPTQHRQPTKHGDRIELYTTLHGCDGGLCQLTKGKRFLYCSINKFPFPHCSRNSSKKDYKHPRASSVASQAPCFDSNLARNINAHNIQRGSMNVAPGGCSQGDWSTEGRQQMGLGELLEAATPATQPLAAQDKHHRLLASVCILFQQWINSRCDMIHSMSKRWLCYRIGKHSWQW